jgi:alpha-1,2-mannosyltransferase
VLIADRRWPAFMAAAATTIAVSLLAYLAFGEEAWRAFFSSVTTTRTFVLEQGATGWEKMQSTFAAARLLGAGIEVAYVCQALVSLATAAIVVWIWRRPVESELKNAALVTGALLATPYVFDYDMMLLALPLAWLAVGGMRTAFLNGEKITLFIVWILQLNSREIGA